MAGKSDSLIEVILDRSSTYISEKLCRGLEVQELHEILHFIEKELPTESKVNPCHNSYFDYVDLFETTTKTTREKSLVHVCKPNSHSWAVMVCGANWCSPDEQAHERRIAAPCRLMGSGTELLPESIGTLLMNFPQGNSIRIVRDKVGVKMDLSTETIDLYDIEAEVHEIFTFLYQVSMNLKHSLIFLDLSGNAIRGELKHLFYDETMFCKLQTLKLGNCLLSQSDLCHLLLALHPNDSDGSTKLRSIRFIDILGPAVDLEAVCATQLLEDDCFCVELDQFHEGDVWSLVSAVRHRLLNVTKVDLAYGADKLTGRLKDILSVTKPGFASLTTLSLGYNKLNQDDISNIGRAVRENLLPRLTELDLRGNALTNNLQHLFGQAEQLGAKEPACSAADVATGTVNKNIKLTSHEFISLTKLSFRDCELCQNDIRSIGLAVKEKALPELRELDLSENTLTNNVLHLFGQSTQTSTAQKQQTRWKKLESLNMGYGKLCVSDFSKLTICLKMGFLPKLRHLNVIGKTGRDRRRSVLLACGSRRNNVWFAERVIFT